MPHQGHQRVTRFQIWFEFTIGCVLAIFAVVLIANTYFCFFNRASCGMLEPILGMYALALALPLLLAACLHRSGRNVLGNLAYLPAIAVAVILLGQALLWW